MTIVLVLWLTMGTKSVFINFLLPHRPEVPLTGMIVVTIAAVFEDSLTMLSISESMSPSVSSDTIALMSSE